MRVPIPPDRRGFSLIEMLVVIAIIGILATLLMPALMKAKENANKSKCASNLRQLAIGAISYGDDKRFFPHNDRILNIDEDFNSDDTPKIVRSLMFYGYHDNPEAFICPSSYDMHIPLNDDTVRTRIALWFWNAAYLTPAQATRAPWIDNNPDPILAATDELSYGWVRKGMQYHNVRSNTLLGSDRAVKLQEVADGGVTVANPGEMGNHEEGWNITRCDASVDFWSTAFDIDGTGNLTAIDYMLQATKGGGYLSVFDQTVALSAS